MNYSLYIAKRKLEDVLLLPFIGLGKLIASLQPLQQEYETFFFFPFYHTGGAEKVHALAAQATGNSKCIIYFTRKSQNNTFYQDFKVSGCTIRDISKYTDNKIAFIVNLVFRGIISAHINKQLNQPIVFNGQCNFAYKISPWIRAGISQVELIHSFNTFSWIRLPFLPFITRTIMISQVRIQDHLDQYDRLKVPAAFKQRIQYIVNGIPLPAIIRPKNFKKNIEILYVGRGTEEKRVHLVAGMARQAAIKGLPVRFRFLGEVANAIPIECLPYCDLLGATSDTEKIDTFYQQGHIVIITSYTEGFPMVIEEGMARGCAIMATPVGDIPIHIKQDENGYLFSTAANEAMIIEEGIRYLTLICSNRYILEKIGEKNIAYSRDHFSIEAFNQQYRQLFTQLRHHS